MAPIKILGELEDTGIPTGALAGCVEQPTKTRFCFGTDTGHSAYLGTKELIKALGGKGKIAHFTGFLVDPNTTLRIKAVEQAVAEAGGGVEIIQVIADIDAYEPADEKLMLLWLHKVLRLMELLLQPGFLQLCQLKP